MFSVGNFIKKSIRIFHLFTKPKTAEFMEVAIVSAIGILIIGLMGTVIMKVFELFNYLG